MWKQDWEAARARTVIPRTRTKRRSASGWRPLKRPRIGARRNTAKWKKSEKRCARTFVTRYTHARTHTHIARPPPSPLLLLLIIICMGKTNTVPVQRFVFPSLASRDDVCSPTPLHSTPLSSRCLLHLNKWRFLLLHFQFLWKKERKENAQKD